jgi:hypothetical protein
VAAYSFGDEELALCREKLCNANLFKRSCDIFRKKFPRNSRERGKK